MRSLVFLVALTICSAQLGHYHGVPWVLPHAKPVTIDPDSAPYLHPFAHHIGLHYLHPHGHPLINPYLQPIANVTLSSPYIYSHRGRLYNPAFLDEADTLPTAHLLPNGNLFTHHGLIPNYQFPYLTAEGESASRRRRDVSLPLPYLHAVPTLKEVTVETQQFEPTGEATPADTTKIELTTKEEEVSVPAVKYVQPHVSLKPVSYKVVSPVVHHHPVVHHPAVYPYHVSYAKYPFHYPLLGSTPVIRV